MLLELLTTCLFCAGYIFDVIFTALAAIGLVVASAAAIGTGVLIVGAQRQ